MIKKIVVCFALVAFLVALPVAVSAQTVDDDQLPADFALNKTPLNVHANSLGAGGGVLGGRSSGAILGVDSLANWSSYFYIPAKDNSQFTWQYTMVGHAPFSHGDGGDFEGETTTINAPLIPVNLDLRNADGSPRFVNGKRLFSDATQFVAPTLASPIFAKTFYSSSDRATQYTDAVQRAEFFNLSDPDWHTMLRAKVKPARTMVLIRGTYAFALNADGTCCRFVLINANTFVNEFFPPTATDTTTVIGAAENAGDITTKDMSTFLFPNAFLFVGNTANCCILGFHSYDVEPGGPENGFRERRYVVNYSSWISPGIFGGGFNDVTALSHELSETFNDPFVNNTVPWWLSPNGNCQNNLEDGDVVEGLPNGTFPITLNGFTYHPQNEALLQWFAGVTPSNAISGAYSYPDTTVLTKANVPQFPNCQ
jgi:hypothetical protein